MNNIIPVAQYYIIKAIFYEVHWARMSFICILTTKNQTVVKERGKSQCYPSLNLRFEYHSLKMDPTPSYCIHKYIGFIRCDMVASTFSSRKRLHLQTVSSLPFVIRPIRGTS